MRAVVCLERWCWSFGQEVGCWAYGCLLAEGAPCNSLQSCGIPRPRYICCWWRVGTAFAPLCLAVGFFGPMKPVVPELACYARRGRCSSLPGRLGQQGSRLWLEQLERWVGLRGGPHIDPENDKAFAFCCFIIVELHVWQATVVLRSAQRRLGLWRAGCEGCLAGGRAARCFFAPAACWCVLRPGRVCFVAVQDWMLAAHLAGPCLPYLLESLCEQLWRRYQCNAMHARRGAAPVTTAARTAHTNAVSRQVRGRLVRPNP